MDNVLQNGKVLDGGFLTPKGRLVFPNLFKPVLKNADDPSGPKVYKANILFDKNEVSLDLLNKWVKDCVAKKFPVVNGKSTIPKGFKYPIFKDADIEGGWSEKYKIGENCWHIEVKNNESHPPVLKNAKGELITESSQEMYGGCYVRFLLEPYIYSFKLTNGITFNLKAVQKIEDGERFGKKKVDVNDALEPIEQEEEANEPCIDDLSCLSDLE